MNLNFLEPSGHLGPVMGLIYLFYISLYIECPLLYVEYPLLYVEYPLLYVDYPLLYVEYPLLYGDYPLLYVDYPLLYVEYPLLNVEYPLLYVDYPLLYGDYPLLYVDYPLLYLPLLYLFTVVHEHTDIAIVNICKYISFGEIKNKYILEQIVNLYLQVNGCKIRSWCWEMFVDFVDTCKNVIKCGNMKTAKARLTASNLS